MKCAWSNCALTFTSSEAKPETLIGDRAYDSDPLDDDLRKDGIEMVAPHRSNRRERATQVLRGERRYVEPHTATLLPVR